MAARNSRLSDRRRAAASPRPTVGKRTADGYRIGQWHGRAVEPDERVVAVLNDYEQGVRGKGYAAVGKKHGLPASTVRDWCTFRTRSSA